MIPIDAASFAAAAAALSALGALAAAIATGTSVRLEHRKWRFDSSHDLMLRLTRRFIDLREKTRSAVIMAMEEQEVNGTVSGGGPDAWELLSGPDIQRAWQEHLPETMVDINSIGERKFREPLALIANALSHVAGIARAGVEPVGFARRACDLAGEILASHQRGDRGPGSIVDLRRRLDEIQQASERADEAYLRSMAEYERRQLESPFGD